MRESQAVSQFEMNWIEMSCNDMTWNESNSVRNIEGMNARTKQNNECANELNNDQHE